MTTHTSHAYFTAADVMEAHNGPAEAIEFYRAQGNALIRRENYARDLGYMAVSAGGIAPTFVGAQLVKKLLADGWTAPEGLF